MTQNRWPLYLWVLAVCISGIGWDWNDPFLSRAERAVKLFEEGEFEDAIELYREEAIEHPDDPGVLYNLGTMLYRHGEYGESLPPYELSKKNAAGELEQRAAYNMGNSLYRQAEKSGDRELLARALDSYRDAVRLGPEDMDAKYNYEFVKRLLEEQEQQQQQQQPDSTASDGSEEEEEQQQSGSRQDDGDGREKSPEKDREEPEEGGEQPEPPDAEEPQEAPRPSRPEEQMSEKDARRMLEALLGKEKDRLEERFRAMGEKKVDVEKDW